MRSRHQAAGASERLYVFQPSTCSGRIRGNDIKGHTCDKSTERTKCALALSAMVTGVQFWQRVTEMMRSPPSSDRHRLLDALARPGNFDCDRYGTRFGSGRRCRIHAAIAGVTSVPPLVILPPNLAVIHRVPPVVIVVLPPMAFVIHRVVVAAKFKTGSALPAARTGYGSRNRTAMAVTANGILFIKLSFNNPHPGSRRMYKEPTGQPAGRLVAF